MRMSQIVDSKPRYSTETFDCIVSLARSIRPQWDVPGLRKAIRDSLARDDQPTLSEIAYAVCRVAENFSVTSPAVIAMDGPHWRAKATPDLERAKGRVCPRCRTTFMPTEDHVCRNPSRAERVASYTDQLRAIVREARAESGRAEDTESEEANAQ
jgi:hypothetical protein